MTFKKLLLAVSMENNEIISNPKMVGIFAERENVLNSVLRDKYQFSFNAFSFFASSYFFNYIKMNHWKWI